MKKTKDIQIIALVTASILFNYIGKYLMDSFDMPIWMDSFGTILTAYFLGPVCGAIVGATVNVMYGFVDQLAFAYMIVNILTGVIAGVAVKKNKFKTLFEVITVGVAIAMVSTIISAPLNYLFNHGYVGNMWGDGMIDLLKEWRFPNVICYLVGEFYVDFLDKIITVLLVFIVINCWNKARGKKLAGAAIVLILMSVCLGNDTVLAKAAVEKDSVNYNSYVQTVYNSMNGLLGGEANDIAATKDGLLWIGTYGGLYRYNGTEFKRMDKLDSVKNVNCIYVDEEGRKWLGTNDDGVSICIDQEVTNVIDKSTGLPANSVRSISCSSDGYYYIGTTDALCVITLSSGIKINKTIPEITYAKRMATDNNKNVVIVTDAGELFLLQESKIQDKLSGTKADYTYTSCCFDEDGKLYVGTSSNVVEYYEIKNGTLVKTGSIECEGIRNFNSIRCDENGRVFICSDFGVGYIYNNQYYPINTNGFNSSIDNMTIDYQGNLWFTSSRLGVLRMCNSLFVELYSVAGLEAKVVNTVVEWNGRLYFGTDNGIDVVDEKTKDRVKDKLSTLFSESRIRCMKVDSSRHLWICTSERGIFEVKQDGSYTNYTEQDGALGNKHRTCLELSDGTMAVAGDLGITFIKNKKIVKTIGSGDGLTNTKILTMTELSDGRIAAGSDGAGIFIIDHYKVVDEINREKGLSSNIILRTVSMEKGLLVATGNGLCFIDKLGNVRKILSFPYNNNYDFVVNGEKIWVLSSAGIYVVDKKVLLTDEIKEYEFLDVKKGLRGSITANSWNYVDKNQNLFVSCDTGVNMINLNHYYDMARKSYRMSVKSINVDGEAKNLAIGEAASIPRGTSRLEIFPEIINYSINDPYVMYYLEGFDENYNIISQSELTSVVYTNLPSGTYTFHLAVMNDKKNKVVEKLSYVITKEKEIYDNKWFLAYATIVFVLVVAWTAWFFAKTQVQKTINFQRKELELVKSQLRLGNETVLAIARTVDAKDVNTSQHSVRVSEYSVLIAKKLGLSEEECENLRKTALLHDIGKIAIPDSVLNKPGRLTDEEYKIMKSHVVSGGEILKDFTLIENVSDGALYHHERYDGKGYVHGLKGEEIPRNARIIGIADAFDAMTANRVYRKKLDFDFVVEEIRKGRGTQFDPQMVDIMLELIENGEIDIEGLYKEDK